MTTNEEKIAALKLRVAALEGRAVAATPRAGKAEMPEPLADDILDRDWADKVVQKDPSTWSGPSMVGKRFSECSAAWHKSAAGLHAWKARKGQQEVPVRVDNKGKPWHEQDTFMAKLHGAWARRLADAPAAPVAGPHDDDADPF